MTSESPQFPGREELSNEKAEATDQFDILYTPEKGSKCLLRFTPNEDGSWTMSESVWTGCHWRPVGSESIEDVLIHGEPTSND